jgi:hypothetical protein
MSVSKGGIVSNPKMIARRQTSQIVRSGAAAPRWARNPSAILAADRLMGSARFIPLARVFRAY